MAKVPKQTAGEILARAGAAFELYWPEHDERIRAGIAEERKPFEDTDSVDMMRRADENIQMRTQDAYAALALAGKKGEKK